MEALQSQIATPESVWAMFREIGKKQEETDVPQILRKAETFRVNFPEYKAHQIYLGLATMVFPPELEQECINEGIAVIKQVGDSVVINDKHLRVF